MNYVSTTPGCKALTLHSRLESTVRVQSPSSAQSGANSPRTILACHCKNQITVFVLQVGRLCFSFSFQQQLLTQTDLYLQHASSICGRQFTILFCSNPSFYVVSKNLIWDLLDVPQVFLNCS